MNWAPLPPINAGNDDGAAPDSVEAVDDASSIAVAEEEPTPRLADIVTHLFGDRIIKSPNDLEKIFAVKYASKFLSVLKRNKSAGDGAAAAASGAEADTEAAAADADAISISIADADNAASGDGDGGAEDAIHGEEMHELIIGLRGTLSKWAEGNPRASVHFSPLLQNARTPRTLGAVMYGAVVCMVHVWYIS